LAFIVVAYSTIAFGLRFDPQNMDVKKPVLLEKPVFYQVCRVFQ
jgi:hypothetical protein